MTAGEDEFGGPALAKAQGKVATEIGPIATPDHIQIVPELPKTRSGKILRGTMRKIADGETYSMPSTIDDPAILPEIEDALKKVGYCQTSSDSDSVRL